MPTKMVQQVTIEDEFKQCPRLRPEDLKSLRDWLRHQSHLPPIENDVTLVMFLRSCDFSLERTKVTIDNYFTFRTHCPEMCDGRNTYATDIQKYVSVCQPVILGRDSNDNIVFLQRLIDSDPSRFDLEVGVKVIQMILESVLLTTGSAPGVVIVFDQTDVGLGHLARVSLNLMSIKRLFYFVQECAPVAIKGIHVIKTNQLVEKMLLFVKPFMNRQLFSLIRTHTDGSMKEFYKTVSQDMLPKEYGGTNSTMAELHRATMNVCEALNDTFSKLDKLKVDESKRVGKTKNPENMFGMEGTFKKLNID